MLRLVLCLWFFVPVSAVLGGFSAMDQGGRVEVGTTIGAFVGLGIALMFGGNPNWKVWEWIFGPKDPNAKDD